MIERHIEVGRVVDLADQPDPVEPGVLFDIVPQHPTADLVARFGHRAGHENAPLPGAFVIVDVDDGIHGEVCCKDNLRGDPAEKRFDRGASRMVAEILAGPDGVVRKKRTELLRRVAEIAIMHVDMLELLDRFDGFQAVDAPRKIVGHLQIPWLTVETRLIVSPPATDLKPLDLVVVAAAIEEAPALG